MSFKHKKMMMRQARSMAIMATGTEPQAELFDIVTIPPWSELVKLDSDEVAHLLDVIGIASTGNMMKDRSAIHKAR